MSRICIVEDQKDVADNLARAIGNRPDLEMVNTYYSAEDALAMIPADRADIILMDIGLPKMDGIECMYKLKAIRPNLKFLMFTIFDADQQLFDALRFGADGYILKSAGIGGALRAVEDLRKGGSALSPGIAKRIIENMRQKPVEHVDFEELTPKQNEILKLIVEGLSNQVIAKQLGITEGTVKSHNNKIFKRLQVKNRMEAMKQYTDRQ
ncbi:MAG: response regulator transcription factor [Bacteroidota bacterium]